jgi:hypothetical protein
VTDRPAKPNAFTRGHCDALIWSVNTQKLDAACAKVLTDHVPMQLMGLNNERK